jgi:hypothetical protein
MNLTQVCDLSLQQRTRQGRTCRGKGQDMRQVGNMDLPKLVLCTVLRNISSNMASSRKKFWGSEGTTQSPLLTGSDQSLYFFVRFTFFKKRFNNISVSLIRSLKSHSYKACSEKRPNFCCKYFISHFTAF